jgi:hypothetical protein
MDNGTALVAVHWLNDPCAGYTSNQSNGSETRAPAASPATSQTPEMTGTSQTSSIVLCSRVRGWSDRLADAPEEVDERDGRAGDDRCAEPDKDAEFALPARWGWMS